MAEKKEGNFKPVDQESKDFVNQKEKGYTQKQRLKRIEEKKGIAKYVVNNLIESGTALFLDAGSTVQYIAREIFTPSSDKLSPKSSLTILTNNMGIFNDLNPPKEDDDIVPRLNHALILTGGLYDRDHDALFGSQAKSGLELFYPHAVVIGTSGFTFQHGLFYHGHTPEEVIKKAIFAKPTVRRIIVCDYTKIGKWDSFLCAQIDALPKEVEECWVVTSTIPKDDLQKDKYEERFQRECARLQEHKKKDSEFKEKVKFVRVDTDGNQVKVL
jgi:DeoR/GlpR family transcriptional regulator of sugar metabolism